MTRNELVDLIALRQERWRRHDAAGLATDHAPDGTVEAAIAGHVSGRKAIQQIYELWFAAFPDLDFRSEELLVDANRAALLWTFTGTQEGTFLGLAPTGRHLQVSGVSIYSFEQGKIVRERRILDLAHVLLQA